MTIVASLAAGALMAVWGMTAPFRVPDFVTQTEGGGSMTFEVAEDEQEEWELWSTDYNSFTCRHYGPSEERVDNVITGIVYETDELWMFSRPLDTSEPGTHTVACGEPADMLYGVARAGTMDATYNRRIVGVIGGAALGLVGLVAGVVMVVVGRRTSRPAE
ncbi:hypothetical protein [Nocardiopsis aegyptia]|uniref:Uncharacterized protein n=1 Tax=Nocardiopsis aegyptia TaxID=220378 RepID=A0A7Z0EJ41_9ACTN|nr:hypothetical protein [Nocardiopsis aegyptia]NYJ33050.1 hypothetical protein [Nocardiopsis aegyptia]